MLFQPVHTALSNIFGRKAIIYICLAFFLIGSIVVGTSQSAAALIAGRTIQGIGRGGLEALCEVTLTDITTLKKRPLYVGILGLMWAGGSNIAPVTGAFFSKFITWRWIAWINIPLVIISLVLIACFLRLRLDRSPFVSKLRRID